MVLMSKSGFSRGAAWQLSRTPLTFGRSLDCSIVIDDSTVSRRQCSIRMTSSNTVVLQDMGSRNPTMVNGKPVSEIVLSPGDEISLGAAIFVVADSAKINRNADCVNSEEETRNLPMLTLARMAREGSVASAPARAEDYVLLFWFARALSTASSVGACGRLSVDVLRERLVTETTLWRLPGRPWHAIGGDAPDEDTVRTVADLGERCTRERIPLIARDHRNEIAYLVANMNSHSDSEAQLALVLRGEHARVDDDILAFLDAVAMTLGPHVASTESRDRLARLNRRLVANATGKTLLIGGSPRMQRVREMLLQAAESDLNVLVVGETGTGKELAARFLHEASARAERPYGVVNCAALSESLVHSELFGHKRGSFTGAQSDRRGMMQQSDGGTLFLDEVGDLSKENQALLLRAIETGTFRPVGGDEDISVDVRIVSATNRRLDSSRFREDLYHRLSGFMIEIPPLRDRREDIPLLVQRFVDDAAAKDPGILTEFNDDAMQLLTAHQWPGNVRELRNCVHRILYAVNGAFVSPDLVRETLGLAPAMQSHIARGERFPKIAEVEKDLVRRALEVANGNMSHAARLLGISRSTLYAKVRGYEGGVESESS